LVALTFDLGRLLTGPWIGLGAAFLAAVNPFQVYYAQEARMYMLLAVLTVGTILALIRLVEGASWPVWVVLVLCEAGGLYTHYSFVFVVLVLNLAFGLWLALSWRRGPVIWRALNWLLSQVVVVLLYLPWLPTAVKQVVTWPNPAGTSTVLSPLPRALADTWRWLVFGPTIETEQVLVPLLVIALLAALGAVALAAGWTERSSLRSRWGAGVLLLWVGLPFLLMLALALYREAYLKFLLVNSPAVTVLLACGLLTPLPGASRITERPLSSIQYSIRLFLGVLLLVPTVCALRNYYADPSYARDDYRAIATYVDAVGRPGDSILLNAPGQQEVFGYYYDSDLPIYPLPEGRPADPAATELALEELAHPGGRVFAVLWATNESDPDRLIESWMETHTYKALDSWYGNVRLVEYAVPERKPSDPDRLLNIPMQDSETGDSITLVGYSQLGERFVSGDIAQITLFWRVEKTPVQRYKVFVHVLDSNNRIVGQRDAEPGGGHLLTTLWEPEEVVADDYGVPIHPATPPGEYRIEVGMYDPQTGQRLSTTKGETQIWLEPVRVDRPAAPAPVEALGYQQAAGVRLGELALLGYDAHKLGFAHQPDAPLLPGDVLHAGLYWRAEAQPSGDWTLVITLVDAEEGEWGGITVEPVADYPTSLWQAGDVWRGQFHLVLPGEMPGGRYHLRLQPIAPDGAPLEPWLSEALVVGR
jgi:hypothetical protein